MREQPSHTCTWEIPQARIKPHGSWLHQTCSQLQLRRTPQNPPFAHTMCMLPEAASRLAGVGPKSPGPTLDARWVRTHVPHQPHGLAQVLAEPLSSLVALVARGARPLPARHVHRPHRQLRRGLQQHLPPHSMSFMSRQHAPRRVRCCAAGLVASRLTLPAGCTALRKHCTSV